MVIHMSSQDKPAVIEHIAFPFTPITKEIFLKETPSNRMDIYIGEKKIVTQQISKEMKAFLDQRGFRLVNSNQKHLEGRKKVFGVNLTVSKNYKGTTIKELLITIPAKTHEELIEKKKILLSGIASITDVKYKHATTDKFVRC